MKTDLNKIQYNIVRAVLALVIIGLSFDIFIIFNEFSGNHKLVKTITYYFLNFSN
jgi:hypothetical protein